jgi:hypothetical protein
MPSSALSLALSLWRSKVKVETAMLLNSSSLMACSRTPYWQHKLSESRN